MKLALLQLNVTDDPSTNLPVTVEMVAQAAKAGAEFVLTPEVTNCVSTSRTHQAKVLQLQEDDQTLAALREAAKAHARMETSEHIGKIVLRVNG